MNWIFYVLVIGALILNLTVLAVLLSIVDNMNKMNEAYTSILEYRINEFKIQNAKEHAQIHNSIIS